MDLFGDFPELTDEYHGVITAQPVQTMDPRELIESLMKIYNIREDGDPNNVGMTRTDTFRSLLRYTIEYMEASSAEIRSLRDNIDEITKLFNHHIHEPVGGNNTAHHSITRSSLGERVEQIVRNAQRIKPQEGQMI